MELSARIYVAGHRVSRDRLGASPGERGFRNLLTGPTPSSSSPTRPPSGNSSSSRNPPTSSWRPRRSADPGERQLSAEFIQANLAVQTNVMHEAWRNGAKRLLFLGSSCIYPRDCPQPIKEEYLLTGPLEARTAPTPLRK